MIHNHGASGCDLLREHGEQVFRGHRIHVEFWSPNVPTGSMTQWMGAQAEGWDHGRTTLEFVVNDEYARAVGELVELERQGTQTSGDPAFRLLQFLTHTRPPIIPT